jgi:predicted nucleic acid-binding protein
MSTTTIRLPDDLKARLAAVSALVKGRADGLGALLNQREFCLSVITEAELRFGLARRVVNADLLHILESFLSYADIRPWACVCPSAGVDGAGLVEVWRPG